MPGKPGPMVSCIAVIFISSFLIYFSICIFISIHRAPIVSQILGIKR